MSSVAKRSKSTYKMATLVQAPRIFKQVQFASQALPPETITLPEITATEPSSKGCADAYRVPLRWALWWLAWIFSCIPTAQLPSRLRLNAIGSPRSSSDPVATFVIVVGLYTVVPFLIYFFPAISFGALVFSLTFTAFTVY
jgi:hypothetical protein